MEGWTDRFFRCLKAHGDHEFEGLPLEKLLEVLLELGWKPAESFWTPDLQVGRFVRADEAELFLMLETYFDPKICGLPDQVAAVVNAQDRST